MQLDLHEGDQRRLTELLRAGDIDLAFLYDFGIADDLQATPLATLSPYVLLPDGHPLAAHERIALADLLDERLVLLDAPPSRDYFLSLFKDVGEPRLGYRAQSFEMVRGMVAHGLGYSLLATRPASSMSYDGKALVTRPLRDQVGPAGWCCASGAAACSIGPHRGFASTASPFSRRRRRNGCLALAPAALHAAPA
jgi:DNA-binding transcriptional LysR family regulator